MSVLYLPEAHAQTEMCHSEHLHYEWETQVQNEDDAGNRRCGGGRIDVKMGMKNKRKKKKTRH